MFDRMYTRGYVALAWIGTFLLLILIFNYNNTQVLRMNSEIDAVEKYLAAGDWDLTQESIHRLDQQWKKARFAALINMGNEEISRVDDLMARITNMSKYKDKNMIDHLGALRQEIQYINQIFSGV